MIKKNAIVMCVSQNLVFSAGTLVLNFESVMAGTVNEYIIIHNGITDKDANILRSTGKVRLIRYEKPDSCFDGIDPQLLYQFTKLVFAKFECLKLLEEYENIIMTDTDILVSGNISELFVPCASGIKLMYGDAAVSSQFSALIPEYDMNRKGMSAGLMVFHSGLKDHILMYEWCYEALRKYADKLRMPEQGIFDLMIQKFSLNPERIDAEAYCRLPSQNHIESSPKILHTAGQPKFWSGYECSEWKAYYHQWVALGGTEFDNKKLLLNRFFPLHSKRRRIAQRVWHFYIRKIKQGVKI